MPTKAKPKTATITITGSWWAEVRNTIKAVASAASRDEDRMVLTAVHIHTRDDVLLIDATDSWRLHRAGLTQPSPWPTVDALIPAAWLVRNLPGRVGISESVEIAMTNSHVTIANPNGTSATAPLIDGTFPGFDTFLGEEATNEGMDGMSFNPKFLADSLKAVSTFTGDDHLPVRVRSFDARTPKPARFDATAPHGTLSIALMPVRVP